MIANCAIASVIVPYASEEIHAASVALSARKRVTFDVVVKKQSYKVHVNIEKQEQTLGSSWPLWMMQSLRIRRAICLSQVMFPSILLKAEHTVFELVTQSENPQFPDIQMKELLIN